jgi:nitroimidazol reductase NimA-like FMN-containing flavoprotein (pyridoxamine 5'-phosphate oxidase superfamily)
MPTERTTVRRLAARGRYEREQIDDILDAAPICHVGFVAEHGPVVLPTIHARVGDTLYLHGSPVSAMLRAVDGAQLCVTATLLDGFVLARSAFHHSMNYRSVVVFGRAREVTDAAEKERALNAVVEHVARGRTRELRPMTRKEIAATRVMALPLDEASAKVRTGPPIDDDEDVASGVWAGVLPVSLTARAPEPDEHTPSGAATPAAVEALARRYS